MTAPTRHLIPFLLAGSMHLGSFACATITATYLPHGPATPANPAWSQTAYRDIPWWFTDDNPASAVNGVPGAADAYDISAVYAARLNKNNSTGYEGALINTPAPVGSAYGTPGGAFGTSAESITWGNGTVWDLTMNYKWNGGVPTASMKFQNGATIHLAEAALGTRITDFVNGTGPYKETHILSDVMMRFATIGAYTTDGSTPAFTRTSLSVADLTAKVGSAPREAITYQKDGQSTSTLTTTWQHVAGGTATTNPRQVEFLVIDHLLPDHTIDLEITGTLKFEWVGSASSISSSGLMFETKLGDLDFFPDAIVSIPEPSVPGLIALTGLTLLRRKRRC